MILAGRDLGLQTGMVVAVPNDEPMEDQKLLADAVGRALLMAEEKGEWNSVYWILDVETKKYFIVNCSCLRC